MREMIKKPEVILTPVLFAVSLAASLYPGEIRRGMRWPGQEMSRKMIESLFKFSENELGVIEHVHGNAYYLVL